ncbi:MAG: hypothetical protein H7A53_06515 [Akkermansiaceae bacterium]|nr:hypothetical protein [Akkermansiaceae bacterium]
MAFVTFEGDVWKTWWPCSPARNFETRHTTKHRGGLFALKEGIDAFMNETHFKRFVMILKSAGFIDPSLIRSQNAKNFAYVVYLS